MSNTAEKYLFLGLPKSGKTTYFSLMAQHLQHVANRTKFLEFRYLPTVRVNKETNEETYDEFTEVFIEDDFTEDFIEDCIARIKKQRWPRKTEGYETGYSFELVKFCSFFGRPILQKYFYSRAVIDYHDYPGEAFEVAFGVGGAPTPDMKKTAEDMKSRIKTARGLFLILDADALFNGQDNKKYRTTLTRLFRCIRDSNPYVKLAIIFNKLELFYGIEHDFVYKFREDYSNAYAYLPNNHKFFNVYPLGSVDTAEDGATIPPKTRLPRNILDPVKWMIGF